MASSEYLRNAAAPLLSASGLELWDVEVAPGVVRFLVDRPGGVDLDALSEASAVLSPLLDAQDQLAPAGRYQLEVSSPGVERTLRTPDQYRRYLGSAVSVKTVAPLDGARRFRGTLTAAGTDTFTVTLDDAPPGATRTVRYDQVDRTRTVLVWGPPPKRGPRAKTAPKAASNAGPRATAGSARNDSPATKDPAS
jgi:ribosome maturation factor RimP